MPKHRREVAEGVAAQLFAAEAAIDAAITATATLTAMMPAARAEARVAACVGQDALAEAMATCMKLVEARAAIVATHTALRATQSQMGLDAFNFGGFVDKPPLFGIPGDGTSGQLRAVADAA